MADIYSIKLIDNETITTGNTVNSAVIPANAYKPLGNFGTQLDVGAGGGTVSVTLYTSMNDGASFVLWPYDLWTAKTIGEYSDKSARQTTSTSGLAVCLPCRKRAGSGSGHGAGLVCAHTSR